MKSILACFILICAAILPGRTQNLNELLVNIHTVDNTGMDTLAPSSGALVYNSDSLRLYVYDGSNWDRLKSGPQVFMGVFEIDTTGNKVVTGLPFKPSQISFVAHANVDATTLNSDNGVGNNNSGINNSFGTANGFARDDGGAIVQQVIYVGGSGNSINDISRYASPDHCIGIRYGNQNGNNLGTTRAQLTMFNSDGFTLDVTTVNPPANTSVDDFIVLYTAYR